jgi:hypothetical protein
MSIRSVGRSPVDAAFKNEALMGAYGASAVALPLRGLAANNYGPQGSTGIATNGAATVEIIARVQMIVGVDSADLIVRFPNWFFQAATGVKNPGNTMQIVEAAFEYGGTYRQLFFSASAGTTIANGDDIASDTLTAATFSLAKFSKGTTCWMRYRLRYSTPASDLMPHMGGGKGVTSGYRVDPTKVNVTNGVLGTGVLAYSMINGGVNGTDAVNLSSILMPIMLGHHSSPVPMYAGDSKTYGTGDNAPGATGVGGMSRLGFTDPTSPATVQWPQMNFGVPSGTALEWSTSVGGADITKPRAYMAYCTHGVVGYGTNSFQTTQLQTLYGYFRAAGISKLIQRSLTPQSTNVTLTINPLTSAATVACSGTLTSTAAYVDQNTYTIQTAAPSAYNGDYVVTVVDATHITYNAATVPGSSPATGTPQILDNWRTMASQVTVTGWSVGGGADTYQQTLKGWTTTDTNLTYYESMGERAASSGANYWFWIVTGAKQYASSDGKHESAGGYELNIGSAGNITTQAGGTVSMSLRTYMPTWLAS